jgi:hypothetical protein
MASTPIIKFLMFVKYDINYVIYLSAEYFKYLLKLGFQEILH